MTSFKTKTLAGVLVFLLEILVFVPVIGTYCESGGKYSDYLKSLDYNKSLEDIIIHGGDFEVSQSSELVHSGSYLGKDNVLIWNSANDEVLYCFDVKTDGIYTIQITYASLSENGSDFEFELKVDGEYPFETAKNLMLPQIWKNGDAKKKDATGNEYAPEQVPYNSFISKELFDPSGAVTGELEFAFSSGSHTIALKKEAGIVIISEIVLSAPQYPPQYRDMIKHYKENSYNEYTGKPIIIEGEDAILKSTRSLVPKSDNSSADVYPNNAVNSVLNYIGDSNWSSPCEELIWEIEIPIDGLYKIGFNYKQDKVINGSSYRSLKIDGKYPFEEAKKIKFDYGTSWQLKSIGNEDEDYLVYLSKGDHTLSLSCTMGDTAEYYIIMEDIVEKIGDLYLDIITITGNTPDSNRDYDLFRQIPNFNEKLSEYRNTLNSLAENMKSLSGERTSQYIAAVNNMKRVIISIINNPYTAQNYISDYYSNYTTLASWISEMKSMPLSLDSIQIAAPSKEYTDRSAGFLKGLAFGVKRFLVSFSSEYNQVSDFEGNGATLKIWVNWGRDQAMVLNSLISESFTPKTGINVNVELTNASLIMGILSGIQPDLALHLPRTEPVNLAMRGALYDLNNFDDYSDVMKSFGESAGEPYCYKNGNYALPDTQAFYIMFYRKDVFEKLDLTVPVTWQDFIDTTVAIQRNNLEVYLPYIQITDASTVNTGIGGLNLFASILMQQGVSIYNSDKTQAALDTTTGFSVFTFWTDFYTEYRVPTTSNFYNRFRVGTTPLGIETYTAYTTLTEAAPEIEGKWGIAMIPGTVREDSSVDHTVSGSGTGCAILQKSKYKKEAWEFIKWWTSAEIQLKYNNNVESILGAVSRTTTANVEAFSNMSWNRGDLEILLEQRKWIKEVPEVPGSYYLSRAIDQAFWEVYNKSGSPKDTLIKWNGIANSEITRKIKEYSK